MTAIDAQAIVTNSWTGYTDHDPRLTQALETIGMTRVQYERLAKEARRVEVGRNRRCVLTPSGLGRRTRR